MSESEKRTAEQLLEAAQKYYGDDGPKLFVDVEEQVVHPACSDYGCVAVKIQRDGSWREGWYAPGGGFRSC